MNKLENFKIQCSECNYKFIYNPNLRIQSCNHTDCKYHGNILYCISTSNRKGNYMYVYVYENKIEYHNYFNNNTIILKLDIEKLNNLCFDKLMQSIIKLNNIQ